MRLTNDFVNTFISVPNIFIDNYMTHANGEFVKVYLCLLRCMQSGLDISISTIADHCSLTENDVLRALLYWNKANVLALEIEEEKISGIRFLDLNTSTQKKNELPKETTPISISATLKEDIRSKTVPSELPEQIPMGLASEPAAANLASNTAALPADRISKTPTVSAANKTYSLDDMKNFRNNPDISELLFVLEAYIKHPLSTAEMNVVFFWIDELKFSKELAEYLIEYCVSGGHVSLRYMEKVALSWSSNHISTVEEAKQFTAMHSKSYYTIMKAFGISGRNLTENELAFLTKWTKEYKFELNIIQEACKRTISNTQKPKFEYADAILTNWKEHNVHEIKDIDAIDTAYNKTKKSTAPARTSVPASRNRFNNFPQRTYDYEELEKLLLTTSV